MTQRVQWLRDPEARRRGTRELRLAVVRKLFSLGFFRPRRGHFYSPVPSVKELGRDAARIFDRSLRDLPGVDLNVSGQLALLDELAGFYADQPFTEQAQPGIRYNFDNFFFASADGIVLHTMIRASRPRRIIEIGSGFSSAVMLDTNELFFDNKIQLTFIEPNAKRLRSLLKEGDLKTVEIVEKRIQDVDGSIVEDLAEGDILFVDSSHVSKVGSDVNYILFEILPRLRPGVLIHFHDVPYPFEYPQEWFELGFYWNEPYLLRAFLQYNGAFTMHFWNDFMRRFHGDRLERTMPLCTQTLDFGVGGSLWLRRNAGGVE